MGHRYGIRISYASTESLHEFLVSLPSFFARSSAYGYLTNGFETKDADAYLFVASENRVGTHPHPDMEVVMEPYGLYINAFTYVDEINDRIEARFGEVEYVL